MALDSHETEVMTRDTRIKNEIYLIEQQRGTIVDIVSALSPEQLDWWKRNHPYSDGYDSKQDFQDRAIEMGLVLNFTPHKTTYNRYHISASPFRYEHISSNMAGYALLGLIYHFENRNWIKDVSYMFIDKRNVTVTFDNVSPTN